MILVSVTRPRPRRSRSDRHFSSLLPLLFLCPHRKKFPCREEEFMGVDQLERISSLKSLTHALGLDDKSVEEVISSSGMSASLSSLSVSSGRPASFASSIGDGYGVSRAKSVSKTPHLSVSSPPKAPETDIRHLSCLQYCQVTGESTCSESISAPKNATDSCSRAPSHSDMHFASSIRSQSVYLEEPSRPAARHRSSCSFLSTSTKASTFASCLHRKAYERGLEGPPRPHIAIGSIILENPAFAAISESEGGLIEYHTCSSCLLPTRCWASRPPICRPDICL
jgi:hypothetical protein